MSTRSELPECEHRGTWKDEHSTYRRVCLYPGLKKHYCKGWLISGMCPLNRQMTALESKKGASSDE